MHKVLLGLGLSVLLSSSAFAAERPTVTPSTATPSTQAVNEVEATLINTQHVDVPSAVLTSLERIIRADPEELEINPAPVAGLYEVVSGMEIVYISADGKHLVMGDIRDASNGQNLTDEKRQGMRTTELNKVSVEQMVVFPATGETKHVVNVFTDVDCPYCTKIHEEVPALNEAGIEVRYLAFPRAGVNSKTYRTMVSVWCAGSQAAQQVAMTDAKNNRPVKTAQCENPVREQYALGQALGVSGTPSLILSTGELVPGYIPAQRLIAHLDNLNSPFINRIRR